MQGQRVTMIRHNLDGIPQFSLPSGYSLRWYRAGDREAWLRIHALAEKNVPTSAQIYDRQFDADEPARAARQAFLLDAAGNEVGTASAWWDDSHRGKRFGRIHWVAIVPEHQGKGLAKPLMTAVCNRLVELGHANAYLTTWSEKLPAIHLYVKFGFEPEMCTPEDELVWKRTLAAIDGIRRG